jgi:anti-sigma regulatory factor (Ser/Thr protein kinase)
MGYGKAQLPPKRAPMPDIQTCPGRGFLHEAVLYASDDEFLDGTLQFVRDGFEGGEPTLVIVDRAKARALRSELERDGGRVYFADMELVGRNPACLVPAWARFAREHGEGPMRGVGEPAWPGRTDAELAECHLHEHLLNVAFGREVDLWLRCPYDARRLPAGVIADAHDTHAAVVRDRVSVSVELDAERSRRAIAEPLPVAPVVDATPFADEQSVARLREVVACHGRDAGLDDDAVADFVLSVHEIATNSLRHGGGTGAVRVWHDGPWLVCEIHDAGTITDPLVGRRAPGPDDVGGRGIWIANHLADLVQLRSSPHEGTTVRVHARMP